jgi:flagellin-specific chaperone FliS
MDFGSGGALAAYRMVAGIGAAPEDFMKMALDAVQTFLRQAEIGIAAADRPAKAQALSSAGKLVEFMLGVSGSDPGRLSQCLAQVYRFMLAAILRGNAADDAEAVAAARIATEQLAKVWRSRFPDLNGSETGVPGWSGGKDGRSDPRH